MAKFKFGNSTPQAIVPKSESNSDVIMDLPEGHAAIIQYVDKIIEKPTEVIKYQEVIKYVDKIVEKPVYLTSYIEREKLMRDKRLRQLLLGSRREMRYMQRNVMDRLDQISQRFDNLPLVEEKIIEVQKIQDVNVIDYKLYILIGISLIMNAYILLTK